MSSYAFPKNSPYHAIFNYNLMRLKEAGGLQVLQERYLTGRICSSKLDTREPEDVSLGMKKIISLFGWLATGFVTALTILMIEKLAKVQTSILHDRTAAESTCGYKEATNIHVHVREQLEERLAPLTKDWNLADRIEFVGRVRKLISEHENGRHQDMH